MHYTGVEAKANRTFVPSGSPKRSPVELAFASQAGRTCLTLRIMHIITSMGSSSEAMRGVKVYHDLVKAVKKHIGKEENKTHFIDFIKSEFRKITGDHKSNIPLKLQLAHDYTFLLNSVHHHKDLLYSYNIAVDRSEGMKKVLGKSAASVGLQLPEVYHP